MTERIGTACRRLTGGVAGGILGRCALAALSISFAAFSVSSFGAGLATEPSRAVIIPSQILPNDHRLAVARPSAPPDAKLDHFAAHGYVIDRLYEELMRWTPPGCALASSQASVAGGC